MVPQVPTLRYILSEGGGRYVDEVKHAQITLALGFNPEWLKSPCTATGKFTNNAKTNQDWIMNVRTTLWLSFDVCLYRLVEVDGRLKTRS